MIPRSTEAISTIRFWIQVSRPGLWFQTIWLYLLPTTMLDTKNTVWWFGMWCVTWPINFLVYGWNDYVDHDIDAANQRKGNFLFGARGTVPQLTRVMRAIPIVIVLHAAVSVWLAGWWMVAVFTLIVFSTATYNLPWVRFRGRPPLDLINALGYLTLIWFSMELNDTPRVPIETWIYLAMFCTHAQLVGEVMDFYPDRESGRATTCTAIGIGMTKLMIIGLVAIESWMLWSIFGDNVLAAGLALGVIGLIVDLVVTRTRKYSTQEFYLAGIAMNAAGYASMIWVWSMGTLT